MMSRFTLLLLLILPMISFAQVTEQSIPQQTQEDQYTGEAATKKAALMGLSTRELLEQGFLTEGNLSSPNPPEGYTSPGGNREPCNDPYIPVDGTYTAVPRNDDSPSLYIGDIGFTFSFCGTSYTDLYINTNGNITFGEPIGQFSPDGFPYATPMIAPFWADVDTRNTACGQAWYKLFGNYMIVSWEEVGFYNQKCTYLNTFQLIISDGTAPIIGVGNNIQFRYGDMNWTTGEASGGIPLPFGGSAATVGYNSGDNINFEQVGRFSVDGMNYDGPFGTDDGVHYLDYNCFVFNSAGGSLLELTCNDITRSLDANCELTITPEEIGHANVDGCSAVEVEIDLSEFDCTHEGENIVTITATSGQQSITCTATVTITTENCPVLSIDQVGPFCEDDPDVTLSATPSGGTWGGAISNGTFSPGDLGPGIHNITYHNPNSCPPDTDIDIEIFASPDVSITPDPVEFCEDEGSTILTATGTGGTGNLDYAWTTPSGNGSGTTYDASVAGIYNVVTTDENGCTVEDDAEVTINPNPVVVIVDPGPICENTPIFTMTGAPSGGTWGGSIISPNGDIFPVQTGSGIYNVTYSFTNSFGCESSDNFDVEIIASPASIPSNDSPYCEGDQIFLYGNTDAISGNIEYIWTGPNNYQSTEQNPTDATEGGAYLLQVIVDGCPSSLEATAVLVNQTPDAIALNGGPYCGGSTIQLFGSTTTFGSSTSYEWIGPNNFYSPEQNPTTAVDPGVYLLTVTVDGCPSEFGTTEVIFNTAPDADASNTGPYCEGDVIILNAETNSNGTTYVYSWTGPNNYTSTEQTPLDAVDPGVYEVFIEVDGCASEPVTTEVVINALPEPTITGSSTFCINGSSLLDAGSFTSYLWSDNSENPTLEVSVEGTYSVTVTDANGCTGEGSFMVEQTESLNPVIIGDLEVCDGENTILDAGAGYTNYLWSNTLTTQTIDVSTADNYSVTVTDASGCSGETTVSFVVNNNPTLTISGDESFCEGESSILDGGTYESYLWSDQSENPTLEVFDSGVYSLEVTDANGCTAVDDITIEETPNPTPTIDGPSSFCTGNSVTLDGGAGYTAYLWSDNSTEQTLELSVGTTVVLTVTDANGCTGETSLEVTENAQLTPVIVGDLEFCEGIVSTLDAGPGYETYEWSNGDTTQTIDVTGNGNYGVVVTDASGCSGTYNVNTIENPNPELIIGGSTTYCIGGSTILDAGAGYETYLWNNTETTQSITVSSPGNYIVEVVDANGCSAINDVDVTESTSLNPVISGLPSFCENDNTILDAGAGFDTYLWSDDSDEPTLQVNVAGDYSITVSDSQGCTGETTISVEEIALPFAVLTSDTAVCNTEAGGSFLNLFDLIQSGDSNGTWTDTDNSGAVGLFNNLNFDGIPAGDYNFSYTTNSAVAPCPEVSYDISITIIDCSCPDVAFFNADPLCNSGEVLDLTTVENTSEEGTWSILQAPPGTNSATINGVDFDATGADSGEYILQFELNSQPPPGCSNLYQTSINVEDGVDAGSADQATAVCFNENETVTLSDMLIGGIAGGTWTETSTVPSQGVAFNPTNGTFQTDGQQTGTYTFQYLVASAGACPDDFVEVEVIINELPDAIAGDGVDINCYNPSMSLDASASSSGVDFAFSWSGPGIVIDGNETTLTPTVDQAGDYTLTIMNNQTGCISSDFVQVTDDFELPQVNAGTDDDLNCLITSIVLQPQGDIDTGFEIEWQGPAINAGNMNEPNPEIDLPGIYTITVTDLTNGCVSLSDDVEVFDQAVYPDAFVELPLVLDCNISSLELIGQTSSNDPTVEWTFNNNVVGTNLVLDNVAEAGIYTLTVTDNATGCSATATEEVFDNSDYPNAEAGLPQLINCYNSEATLDGSDSDNGPNIVYQWTGPAGGILGSNTDNLATAVLSGTYVLTVENTTNGCISTDEVIVDEDTTVPDAIIANPDELNCSVTEVTLDASLSSSGNNITYSWTDPSGTVISTDQNLLVDGPGTFSLFVLNTDNGCSNEATMPVSENADVPYATITNAQNPDCFGDSNGFIAVEEVLGGTAPFVYSVNGNVFSNSNIFANLGAGTYDLALEDANGCTWDTTVVITEPAEITLELYADSLILLGESANVNAIVNIPVNQIDTIIWTPDELFNCSDSICLDGNIYTFNTMPVSATVIDQAGCRASDEVMIVIDIDRHVFIPNAFSPNNDGQNDIFHIFGDAEQIVRINKFAVFNRWGEVMFEATGFQPNDPLSGWDGNLNGEPLNPGVFVYFAEIEFIDGHVQMYKGDVTLLK